MGDPSLVLELGEICHQAGFAILYKPASGKDSAPFPKHFKKVNTIPRTVFVLCELSLDRELKKKNLLFIDKAAGASAVILSSSITVTASEQASWIRRPSRLVGISTMPTLLSQKLIELAPTIHTDKAVMARVQEFFARLGKELAIVQDRIGMVMPRILCMLINEAFFALTEHIASPQDIDLAMKLGTNYPRGPIEWADQIGIHSVVTILEAIHDDLDEDRYRIAPLLKQMALGAQWWGT